MPARLRLIPVTHAGTRQRAGTLLSVYLVLLLASCGSGNTSADGSNKDPSGSNPPTSNAPSPPTYAPQSQATSASITAAVVVNAVEIVPPTIHANQGEKFEIYAIARDILGTPIGQPGPVTWSGGVTFTSANSNPTLATAPTGNTSPVSFSVAIGGKTATGRLILRPTTAAISDEVRIAHAPGTPVEALLIDANEKLTGSAATDCKEDLLFWVAGSAGLDRNLTTGCTNRIAVFSIGHAVRFECMTGTPRPNCKSNILNLWTDGSNTIVRDPLAPPPLGVDLAVWYRVSQPESDARNEATTAAGYATDIFRTQRAGIAFNILRDAGGYNGTGRSLVDPDQQCTAIESNLGFSAVSGVVNVVYVDEILFGADAGVRGLACERSDGGPRIVVVSWARMVPSTLAHELAHLMGHMKSFYDPNDWRGGHTSFLSTFDETNLMWSQENATVGLERDRLTLGQVYRMHVDDRSWVNVTRRNLATGMVISSIRTGDMERCQQAKETSTPCPKLHLDARAQ